MKVALVGTCPSSRYLAPFQDRSWEIWACGIENTPDGIVSSLPRIDKFFEIHASFLEPSDGQFLAWLNEQPFEIWMTDQRFISRANVFPKDACLDRFGPYFFTSTTSLMFAKAILDGAKEIALYGTDLANNEERRSQRSGVHHFIWLAEQCGIRVSAPIESDILNPPPLYGFDEYTRMGRKLVLRSKELKDDISKMEEEQKRLALNIERLKGALEDNEYHQAIWTGSAVPVPIEQAVNVIHLAAKG